MRYLPLALALSCGPLLEDDPECSGSRTGLYDVEFTRTEGDCGRRDDVVMYLDRHDPFPDGPECTLRSTRVTDGTCRYVLGFACATDDSREFWDIDTTAWDDGARADGTLELAIEDANGELVCVGTYDVKATRE